MKATEKFTEFQTRFLQLAGQARISSDNLIPDLFDKLILELCCTIPPQYSTMTSLKQLTDQCQAVDQGLQRIKAESDCMKKGRAFAELYRTQRDCTERYSTQNNPTERSACTPHSEPSTEGYRPVLCLQPGRLLRKGMHSRNRQAGGCTSLQFVQEFATNPRAHQLRTPSYDTERICTSALQTEKGLYRM
jgi:hypothetical protein